jgi:hypothetical protein
MLFGIYLLLLPVWFTLSYFNEYTRHVLVSGWVPILVALFISSLSGITLSQAIDQFTGIVVFQPIINGVGGSLSSIQASKISTMLHQVATMGQVPSYTKIVANPLRALFVDRKCSVFNVQAETQNHPLFSTLREIRSHSHPYVHSGCGAVCVRCRFCPHEHIDNWRSIRADLFGGQFDTAVLAALHCAHDHPPDVEDEY